MQLIISFNNILFMSFFSKFNILQSINSMFNKYLITKKFIITSIHWYVKLLTKIIEIFTAKIVLFIWKYKKIKDVFKMKKQVKMKKKLILKNEINISWSNFYKKIVNAKNETKEKLDKKIKKH